MIGTDMQGMCVPMHNIDPQCMAHLQDQQGKRQTSGGHAQHPLQLLARHPGLALLAPAAPGGANLQLVAA